MSEPLTITLAYQEVRLQLLTLRSQLKFHQTIVTTSIESFRKLEMEATASLVEQISKQHIEVLEQSIAALTPIVTGATGEQVTAEDLAKLERANSREGIKGILEGYSPEYLASCGIV